MWTCTPLFSYLTDMLKTPPCQCWAWHMQPSIISVIGTGPFMHGRDDHSKCCKNPSRCRHHSKWVFPSWGQAVWQDWSDWKLDSNGEQRGKLRSEWQVNTCQPHGRSRCWCPSLSRLGTYGADGKCWSLTWADRSWYDQICTRKHQYIFIYSALALWSWNGAALITIPSHWIFFCIKK